ncbi:MAG: hypothetical protein MHPSP_004320, partial [Paramarteilia canceri]
MDILKIKITNEDTISDHCSLFNSLLLLIYFALITKYRKSEKVSLKCFMPTYLVDYEDFIE